MHTGTAHDVERGIDDVVTGRQQERTALLERGVDRSLQRWSIIRSTVSHCTIVLRVDASPRTRRGKSLRGDGSTRTPLPSTMSLLPLIPAATNDRLIIRGQSDRRRERKSEVCSAEPASNSIGRGQQQVAHKSHHAGQVAGEHVSSVYQSVRVQLLQVKRKH